ncbi:MAG: LysR family transcriptional regulator [Exiguobacterium profundum]|nr:MAG: LysR family transcriptional regulator [Exiguobacterium profundum]
MDALADWTLIRSFLAVAETGSLSAAARRLGLTQPTLGRHITELESALGLDLFTRQPRGLAPTETAAALLPHARSMAEAAARLSLTAAGREERLAGPVRITASRVVAHHLLPAILADLRRDEPGIEIELVASDTAENLMFREADIALRMYRPDQLDLVAAHVADLTLGLYAAPDYLDRRVTANVDELLAHDIVGFDRSDLMIRMMAALGLVRRRGDFPVRCDDQLVHWNLVRAGLGIGGAQRIFADADPAVERIAPFLRLPPLPLWIAAPEALRHQPRIARVFAHLLEQLRQAAARQPRD